MCAAASIKKGMSSGQITPTRCTLAWAVSTNLYIGNIQLEAGVLLINVAISAVANWTSASIKSNTDSLSNVKQSVNESFLFPNHPSTQKKPPNESPMSDRIQIRDIRDTLLFLNKVAIASEIDGSEGKMVDDKECWRGDEMGDEGGESNPFSSDDACS